MSEDWLKILQQRFPSGILFNGSAGNVTKDTEYLVECPFCGHRIVPKQMHSSFNVITGAFFCFVCGEGANRKVHLRDFLSGGEMAIRRTVRLQSSDDIITHHWLHAPIKTLWYTTQNIYETLSAWRRYEKAINIGILTRYKLGYTQGAIVYPIYLHGEIVGFRPRRDGKWMNVKGSRTVLFDLDSVGRGDTVVFVESPVSAMLGNYYLPFAKWLAPTSGAGTNMKNDWVWKLNEFGARVAVCYDNDDAGRKGTSKIINIFGDDTPVFEYKAWMPTKYDARDLISNFAVGEDDSVLEWVKTISA